MTAQQQCEKRYLGLSFSQNSNTVVYIFIGQREYKSVLHIAENGGRRGEEEEEGRRSALTD